MTARLTPEIRRLGRAAIAPTTPATIIPTIRQGTKGQPNSEPTLLAANAASPARENCTRAACPAYPVMTTTDSRTKMIPVDETVAWSQPSGSHVYVLTTSTSSATIGAHHARGDLPGAYPRETRRREVSVRAPRPRSIVIVSDETNA